MSNLTSRATDWHTFSIPAGGGTTNNAALTTSANKAPVNVAPESDVAAGRFVLDLRGNNSAMEGPIERAVHYDLAFAGTDAADEAFTFRVWHWRPAGKTWLPRLLLIGAGVLGARNGIADGDLGAAEFLADTITVSEDNTRGASAEIASASEADGLAVLSFDADGPGRIEIELTIGAATSVRPLLAAK